MQRDTSAVLALILSLAGPGWAAEADDEPGRSSKIEEITVFGQQIADDHPFGLTLDAEELSGVPGTQDDALRAIVTLPGVAVNNDFETGVAIRGSRPGDNRYYLDFLPTGYLFHLTGLSVVDSDMVAGFSLYPAGFGTEYQNVIGGVVKASTRDPRSEFQGLVDISLLDAGVLVEGPLTDRQRGMLSTRISYYDVVLGKFIEEAQEDEQEGVDIVQLPRYRDYRGQYQIDVGEDANLDFLVDGARDDISFIVEDDAPSAELDPATAGSYRFDIEYNRQGVVYSNPNSSGLFRMGVARVENIVSGDFGDIGEVEEKVTRTAVRLVNESTLGRHTIKAGTELSNFDIEQDLVVRDNGCTEFDVDCLFSDETQETSRVSLEILQGNIFVEDEIELGASVSLVAGVGYTADDYLDESRLEPRLRLDWDVTRAVSFSIGGGRYSQLPDFDYIDPSLGNPSLGYMESEHWVAGVDLVVGSGIMVSIDSYYKTMDKLITSDPAIRYDDLGEGYAWGLETMIRKGYGDLSGWVSVSWSRATREDTETGQKIPFEFDQPIIASVVGKYELFDDMTLSGRIAFHSGPPVTPILGSTPDPDRPDGYLPVYGEINSDRLPNYFRTDLRLDWELGWDTTVYFEVINATNHENVAAYEYNVDYSDRKDVTQLPFFVSVGAKKSW